MRPKIVRQIQEIATKQRGLGSKERIVHAIGNEIHELPFS
jgi:hypothetical protein